MQVDNYLRLALMLGQNKAQTFHKNLEKMITLVLFDNHEQGMTVSEILIQITQKYALNFSDAEILQVIKKSKQKSIIALNDDTDESKISYTITPIECEKIKARTDISEFHNIISDFLMQFPDINALMDGDAFRELLTKYLYSVFNSNADTILALLHDSQKAIYIIDDVYSEEEKYALNTFLNWENEIKNKYIFMLVSCCFDYCMMTVGKDRSSYQNLFRNKNFYLDTNIIFRLMGLNNESRKQVISSFMEKCKEVGIQICYTNHTVSELDGTIKYYVNKIKEFLKGNTPISVSAMERLDNSLSNNDFYAEFVKWCDNPMNRVSDYTGFIMDLKKQADTILRQFKKISFDDFRDSHELEFKSLSKSLKEYKIRRNPNKYINDKAIRADINNYMYILDKNSAQVGSDFFSINHFLISADHSFSAWVRERRPGDIPIVVLPSVWYSVILQYAGRNTDADYISFSRFLNLNVVESLPEPMDDRKKAILKYVLSLKEPKEIKEQTIFDISSKLQTEYRDLDSEEVVKKSHQFIVDARVQDAKKEAEDDKKRALAAQKNEATATQSKMKEEFQKTLEDKDKQFQADTARMQAEYQQALQNAANATNAAIDNAKKEGQDETLKKIIESEVNRKVHHRIVLYKILTFGMILFTIGLPVATIYILANNAELSKKYLPCISIICLLLTFVGTLSTVFIPKYCFKEFKGEEIEVNIRKKVEKNIKV